MAKRNINNGIKNVERTLAAHGISTNQHLQDVKTQNDLFIKEYEKKLSELDEIDQKEFPKEYRILQNEISKIGAAVKINENTIKQLELS